jgi:hypothetical protein
MLGSILTARAGCNIIGLSVKPPVFGPVIMRVLGFIESLPLLGPVRM